MPIRRPRLPLILQVRAAVAVMLLRPPGDWGGGHGRARRAEWTYKCTICNFVKRLPEQVFGRDVPFCEQQREHGRLKLVEKA